MNKIYHTMLITLASVLLAGAQTNSTPPATTAAAPAAAAAAGTNTLSAMPDNTTDSGINSPAMAGEPIPHIKLTDVPITVAIENLARQANINFMLDPKIGYGQPDANGIVKPEPQLSIRWENITAANALLALLDNYSLQLIEDKKTGIARITIKDPTAPPPLFTKVVQLKYAGVSNLVDAAQSVLTDKRSKVLADPRTSQLVVVATDPEQLAVETLVNQLDRITRQVFIETRLIEISSNPRTQKGVDWSGTLQAHTVKFGNSTGPATAASPGGVPTYNVYYNTAQGFNPGVGYLSADGLSAVMSFLNSSSDAQVMSTPRVVTLDNEMSTISVVRTYPIFNVQAGTQNSAGGSSVTYSNIGTVLHVTPRISANDYIWLKVMPEVSSFFGNFKQVTGGGDATGAGSSTQVLTAPVFDFRTINTEVLIPNANTLVMGGLVQDNPQANYTKVPLLGSIPGLGRLFSSEDKQTTKDNLLIFITPTIVKDDDFQTSKSGEFLKSKPISMKDTIDPHNVWDSSLPDGNWSDPITESTK